MTGAEALAAVAASARHIAVGGGGLGLIGIVVLALLFGVDPSQLLNGADTGDDRVVIPRTTASPRADDASFQFARKIVGSAEDACGSRCCGRRA